jgi:hypothetical protein
MTPASPALPSGEECSAHVADWTGRRVLVLGARPFGPRGGVLLAARRLAVTLADGRTREALAATVFRASSSAG